MERSAIITYEGRELEIEYDYEKPTPSTYEYEGDTGYFDIYAIRYTYKGKTRDIIGLLSQKTIKKIEEKYMRDSGNLF